MRNKFTVAQIKDLLNKVNNEEISFSRFVEILNEIDLDDDLTKAINEIENAMQRWHLGRDEDEETLEHINQSLVNIGLLGWFNHPTP